MKFRPYLSLLAAPLFAMTTAHAQVPTKCFEIESILVDACNPSGPCPGSSEGQNEMVRFRTGPEPLNLVDIAVDWPNNPWRGFIQTAQTAALTAQLNASIVSCGWLLEPPSGVVPPGSTVILVGSVDMCVPANSFANLTDTIYMTYQATGNIGGHFANHNNGPLESPVPVGTLDTRTLVMTHGPTACHDTVTYDRSQLVNQNGMYGGFGAMNDGATVDFTWPGVPVATYYNNGCQAPVNPLLVNAEAAGAICDGGTVALTGNVSGSYTDATWQGGTGTFADPDALSTTYTAGPGDVGTVVLQLCVTGACDEEQVCATVTVEVSDGPQVQVTADGPLSLCPGQTLTLTASGADSYDWGAQGSGPSIVVDQPGTYTVTGSNICGEGQATVEVTSGENVTVQIDGPTTICAGQQVQLTASGADTWLWSTNEVTATIVIDQPGTYSVTGTTDCGSGEASIIVVPGAPPDVAIDGPTLLCGAPVQLTATGADTWLWSTNATTAVITVDQPGEYTVTGTTACGTDQASITIVQGEAPLVAIAGDTVACEGSTVQLTATGADSYLWSTQETTAVIEVTAGGTYTVVGTTACGTAQAGVDVIFNGPPTASIDGGTTLCPVATLTAVGEGDVLWSTGDTAATIIVTEPGTISLTITGACGTGSATVDVTDSPLPVHIGAAPTEGIAPLPVQFTAHTDEGAGLFWDLGDGTTSTEQDPLHTYTDPGEYTVVLTAQLDGCTAQAQALIIVHAEPGIEVPNVFSPNGDGHNDVLQVAVRGIAELDLSLFNRWGQLVYRIEHTHQVWDGRTMAGEPVPEGTYFYVVDAVALDGTAFREKGHVTVLR